LMKSFDGSKTALVADVDCTAAGKDLCETHGVEGFPTIKWGDPSSLEDYDGGRDFEELKKFAEENLKPMCSPTNIELCDEDKKKQITELMAMDAAALDAKIAEKVKKQEEAEETFNSEVEKLQKRYEELEEEKKAAIAEVKASGLGLMKAVKAAKKPKEEL